MAGERRVGACVIWQPVKEDVSWQHLEHGELPGITYPTPPYQSVAQHTLVERHLERNVAHRRGAFGSSQGALVYNDCGCTAFYL